MAKNNQKNIETIVIIEDDFALSELLKQKIDSMGFLVENFINGNNALPYILKSTDSLLVIIDFELPDINGIELVKRVHQTKKNIPFIVITGEGSEEVAINFLRLGVSDYLIKDSNFLANLKPSIEKTIINFNYQMQIELQQQIIAQNEKKFRLIFENMQDVFAILDSRFRIIEISPAIESLLQISPEKIIGKTIFNLETNRHLLKIAFHKLVKEKYITDFEIDICHKAKNIYRTCQINAKIIKSDEQHYAVITMRDITNYKQLQREFLTIATVTEEKERTRISEHLHDVVAPTLTTANRYLEMAVHPTKTMSEKNELINESRMLIEDSIQCIRQLSNISSSNVLSEYGLEKAFLKLQERFSKLEKPELKFTILLLHERFNPVLENIAYRTVTELVHNSLKHADAQQVVIHITEKENYFTISYRDDGKGFDYEAILVPKENATQQGLFLMNIRIKSLGGSIIFERLSKGISLRIDIPVKHYLLPA